MFNVGCNNDDNTQKITLCIKEKSKDNKTRKRELQKYFNEIYRKVKRMDKETKKNDKIRLNKLTPLKPKLRNPDAPSPPMKPLLTPKTRKRLKSIFPNYKELKAAAKNQTRKNKSGEKYLNNPFASPPKEDFLTPEIKVLTANKKKCKRPCVHPKFCNHKTGRCNKKKKKKVKKTRKKYPKALKRGQSITLKVRSPGKRKAHTSYSPSINKKMISLQSFIPRGDIYRCRKRRDIKAVTRKGEMKCVSWKDPYAKKIMLENLFSNKYLKYTADDINTPKQVDANCWLNAVIMVLFISDKGRKFFRSFRKAMITSKFINGKPLPKKAQWAMFLFNKYIDAILKKKSESNFALTMDTEHVIDTIHKAFPKSKIFPSKKKGNNSELFIFGMLNYLASDDLRICRWVYNPKIINPNLMDHRGYLDRVKKQDGELYFPNIGVSMFSAENMVSRPYIKLPHLIIVIKNNGNFAEDGVKKIIEYKYTKQNKIYQWKLDSMILSNVNTEPTEKFHAFHHASSYITFNGVELAHDGYMATRHVKFDWSKYLTPENVNKNWKFIYPDKFENENGIANAPRAIFFYYRVK